MWMEHPGKVLGLVALQMVIFVLLLSLNLGAVVAQSDADAMQELKKSLNLPSSVDWTDANPCNWQHVRCVDNRVTRIQLGNKGVSGSLSPSVAKLTELQILELMGNNLTGPLPSLKGLKFLNVVWLGQNQFNSIPVDFFDGLTRLVDVYLDHNPFSRWSIPDGLHVANTLANFSVNSANVVGKIPDFFNPTNFPSLQNLHLSGNALEGPLPSSFGVLTVQSLWLNGQFDSAKGQKTLNGTIEFLGNMTQLVQVWLNKNGFTGPIPDLSGLSALKDLNLRDNSLTGPVPTSLVNLKLNVVNLTNNHLQGPTPKFSSSVNVDMKENSNSFCLPDPGVECDKRVDVLISVLEPAKYPWKLADGWKGNDPCTFTGITCLKGNITIINLQGLNLSGIISPNFAALTSVQTLILSHNNITGEVPTALATMPNLKTLDLSFNHLNVNHLPQFESRTAVNVDGNSPLDPSSTGEGRSSTDTRTGGKGKLIGGVIGSVCAVLVVGLILFYCQKRKRKYGRVKQSNAVVVHPNHPDAVKISVTSGGESFSQGSSGSSDVHVIKTPDMVISIQVLRSVTNNFSEKNILGKGGFGTVYYGELPNGTKIAVKRMNSAVLGDKGLAEFKSEIAVLSKVRHRHLVALLGYCLDGNDKVLVYEYLPQGTLSQHLFSWKEIGWKPLEWKQRLTIALDVARGVEYLHGLAHQSFIHRDLKPSNILLGDDMRAKVADFGLVRLAPDGGKVSIETRLAGTFGYLAPEYAVTGRITTKVDIFSFGVILMEIITGRKALDESQPEDSVHLVTWFRRVYINKTTFQKAIDPTIDLDEETLASVNIIAELACHCCAREHSQRPEMGHIVNVLSSLTDKWKPTEDKSDDVFGIDLDMTLPQALKKWQALGDSNMDDSSSSSLLASDYSTQTSLPTRPTGFATSFASADGR